MLIEPISRELFAIYALSLPEGPNFEPLNEVSWWSVEKSLAVGVITHDPRTDLFSGIVLRRNVDHRFFNIPFAQVFHDDASAVVALIDAMQRDLPPAPLRSGEKRRPGLFDVGHRTALNPKFELLRSTWSHYPAMMAIGETYLAMDRPDDNFVSDFQTEGFDGRLWELYLLAAFREQGVRVSQSHPSPDFLLQRGDCSVFVEASTANPDGKRNQPLIQPRPAPIDLQERTIGSAAVRFAKSLKSKMDRRYWALPHVEARSFAIAIADFHQAGSMTWTGAALQSYLYGFRTIIDHNELGQKSGRLEPVTTLLGEERIPAGLFQQADAVHLSAVISSNAATISKFNRMGYLAGWKPPGLTIERTRVFFSYAGNRIEPEDFHYDLNDPAYQNIWPFGECWCLELEVYHNPRANYPIPRNFLPGATHFFEREGELVFEGPWEKRVLASVTTLKGP